MKLAQLLEQLNQLTKERPEALEMEVSICKEIRGKITYPKGWKTVIENKVIRAQIENDLVVLS